MANREPQGAAVFQVRSSLFVHRPVLVNDAVEPDVLLVTGEVRESAPVLVGRHPVTDLFDRLRGRGHDGLPKLTEQLLNRGGRGGNVGLDVFWLRLRVTHLASYDVISAQN